MPAMNTGPGLSFSYVRWTEKRNMEEFLRLAAQQSLRLDALITHRVPLEDAAQAYEIIMDPSQSSLAVLLSYPAAADAVSVKRPASRVEVNRAEVGGSEIGVALVGAGNLARWVHLPNLKKAAGVRLRAIQSGNGSRAKSYALRFGAEYCTSDFDEIIGNPAIQVVVIVSRNQQHAAQALAALRAGQACFRGKTDGAQ